MYPLEAPELGASNEYYNTSFRAEVRKISVLIGGKKVPYITKTYLYNFDPLKPLLYSKTWVYRGIHYFFLFLLKNIGCEYSLEPPRRSGSKGYPQSRFWAEIWKMSEFLSETFQILVVKFTMYLNRRIFLMPPDENTICKYRLAPQEVKLV